jgi:hypothetical protein
MFYFIIFSILALFALLEMVDISPNDKKRAYIFISVGFVLIGSLRWNTGNDWMPYYNFFTSFTTDNPYFLLAMEPGFAQFVKFLRVFSNNFTFYLTVLSILTIGIKAAFFYEYSGAIFLAAILYWGTNLSDVIAVRQSMAISLCLLSTHFIIIKKPWYFVVFVYIAAQIHITSYIFLFAYFVYHVNWSVRAKYLILIMSVFVGALSISQNLLQIVIDFTPSGVGLDRINEKAQSYLESGNEENYGNTLSKTQRLIAAITKRSILLPIFFYFQERLTIFQDRYKGFLNLYTFGNVIFFLVVDFLTLQRLASYFYIFEILLFTIIFVNVRSKSVWLIIIIAYSLFKLISLIVNMHDLLIPIIWIFSNDLERYVY